MKLADILLNILLFQFSGEFTSIRCNSSPRERSIKLGARYSCFSTSRGKRFHGETIREIRIDSGRRRCRSPENREYAPGTSSQPFLRVRSNVYMAFTREEFVELGRRDSMGEKDTLRPRLRLSPLPSTLHVRIQ